MSINVVPTDAFYGQSVSNTALRVEKVLRFGVHRFGFYADIQNLFNLGIDHEPERALPEQDADRQPGERF